MKSTLPALALFILASITGNAQIKPESLKVQGYMPANAVIAHRGTIYWAPELTEAAFRWARNTGADYLELDVHRSKDGALVIMHDRTFRRTTDVDKKFPGRENDYIDSFSLEEILKLDAGSAFNTKNPGQARNSFSQQGVLVFEDVFRIAEGKRIKRNSDGSRVYHKDLSGKYLFEYENDPADNGNRPGIYIEFKIPENYPGIEEEVYTELTRIGWNILEGPAISEKASFYLKGKVNTGNTRGKILLQTFSRKGMENIQRVFREEVLASFLIGNPKSNDFARGEVTDEITAFAKSVGAQFIGTNLGETNDGLSPDFSSRLHKAGLKANVYSFNTVEQMEKYFGQGKGRKAKPLADGMITNRADLTTRFYYEKKVRKLKPVDDTPETILENLGY